MLNPDIYELNSLPQHRLKLPPSKDETVTPLQYLVPKWKNKGVVDLTKHGVNQSEPIKVIYPTSHEIISQFQTLVVLPLPGCRQEYSIDEIDHIIKKGGSITIKLKAPPDPNAAPIHFSIARFWMRERVSFESKQK